MRELIEAGRTGRPGAGGEGGSFSEGGEHVVMAVELR